MPPGGAKAAEGAEKAAGDGGKKWTYLTVSDEATMESEPKPNAKPVVAGGGGGGGGGGGRRLVSSPGFMDLIKEKFQLLGEWLWSPAFEIMGVEIPWIAIIAAILMTLVIIGLIKQRLRRNALRLQAAMEEAAKYQPFGDDLV